MRYLFSLISHYNCDDCLVMPAASFPTVIFFLSELEEFLNVRSAFCLGKVCHLFLVSLLRCFLSEIFNVGPFSQHQNPNNQPTHEILNTFYTCGP